MYKRPDCELKFVGMVMISCEADLAKEEDKEF
jgi:hypothetical protein